jgi:cell division initiation protein
MDLSPKLLTDIQFREQWRGYNPEEVDEFLERVAAGVEELQSRLNEALERASRAEHRLLERSDDDEIRRTLVLAQRTAVASIEEARAEADRLVSETDVRCRSLVADAEAEAAKLDAEITTRRQTELAGLAAERDALQDDIDAIHDFLARERARLTDVLRGQVTWVERELALGDTPRLSDVAAPPVNPDAPPEMRAAEIVDAPPRHDPAPDVDVDVVDDEPSAASSPVHDLRQAREDLADALRRAGVEPLPMSGEVDHDDDEALSVAARTFFDDEAGDATGTYDSLAGEAEPGDPVWREEAADEDDDPFLAELRRAVVDTEPLGPRDHVAPPPRVDDDDDDESSGGFLRRRRRG